MGDVSDEIDSLVNRGEPPAPRARRGRPRKEADADEEGDAFGVLLAGAENVERLPSPEKSISTQEQDLRELLPKELPQPVEKVKTLDEMVSKFRVGQDTQFKLQVYRLTPKFFPGGIKADGYYDEWTVPLSEDIVASEYGGGQYRIRVMGPSPENPTGWKSYDSVVVDVGGEPKYGRRPRASQATAEPVPVAPAPTGQGPYQMMGASEDPKLSVEALKMSRDMANAERDERRRIEDRIREDAKLAGSQINPLIEAHKQRADEVAQVVREKSDLERRVMEERLSEERGQRQRLEDRIALMEQSRPPSVAEEMGKLMALMPKSDDGSSAAQKMLEQVLNKHQSELEAVSASYKTQLDSVQRQSISVMDQLRDSHRAEQAALRDSHARQMEAEREAWRSREERAETVLAAEREERRRDREMFQRNEESRDRQWKDRMENQELNLKAQWESRLSASESALKMRIEWLQSEIDKKESDVSDLRGRLQENSDPQAQFEKMAAFRDAAKNAFGMTDTPPPAAPGSGMGGIGMGNPLETFAEAAGERAPEIINAFSGLVDRVMGGGGKPAPQKQQYQAGQIVQTPQGPMVVVLDANQPGGLGLKSVQAVQAEQEEAARRGGPAQMGDGRRPRLVDDMEGMVTRRQSKKRGIIPNYAEGLPRPNQPGEPVHPPMPEQRRTSRAAPRTSAQPTPQPTPPAQQAQTQPLPQVQSDSQGRLSAMEKQVARSFASAINDAVMRGDDPEDFVAQVVQQAPPPVIAAIAQKSTDEMLAAIREVAPQSAGATPAGEKFTRQAVRLLRQHTGAG